MNKAPVSGPQCDPPVSEQIDSEHNELNQCSLLWLSVGLATESKLRGPSPMEKLGVEGIVDHFNIGLIAAWRNTTPTRG